MNVDNMRAVANLIELEDRFSYTSWTEGVGNLCRSSLEAADALSRCGTTGCVAGWAAHLARREGSQAGYECIEEVAQDYLGLDLGQASRLFNGRTFRQEHDDGWENVTAVEIAKFMRSVADGETTL